MKTRIAWHIITHNKKRAFAVIGSISFAILLMFLQLGLYYACQRNASIMYELWNYNAVLVSRSYMFIFEPGTFPIQRIYQARGIPGVANASPMYTGYAPFKHPLTGFRESIFIMGVNCADSPLISPEINAQLSRLSAWETALMDTLSLDVYGPHDPGVVAEVGHRRLRIIGNYTHGPGFISYGSLIVSDRMFMRLFDKASLNRVNYGVIRFAPGVDPTVVVEALRAALPDDVSVFSRKQLEKNDQYYMMNVNPIGIMFTSGVVIAFLVGSVIIYQILTVEVTNNLAEYATLKAIGYPPWRMQAILLEESLLFILLGFLPALPTAWYLYSVIKNGLHIPIEMTSWRIIWVLTLSLAMSVISGLLAIRKVAVADPAELF
jgi:putative ABC transport system permease protein